MSTIDQQFVEYIIKNIVTKPEDILVDRQIDEKGVLLTLTVNPEDLGRVIGRRGATAQSLRTLLRALGTKNDAHYNLKIVNNDGESPEAKSAPAPAGEAGEGEAVENISDFAENAKKTLAELDDLDI